MTAVPPPGHLGDEGYEKLALNEPIPLGKSGKSVSFKNPKNLTVNNLVQNEGPNKGKIEFTCGEKTYKFRIGKKTPLFEQIQGLSSLQEEEQITAIKAITIKYIASLLKVKDATGSSIKSIKATYANPSEVSIKADGRDVSDLSGIFAKERTARMQFAHLATAEKVNRTAIKALCGKFAVERKDIDTEEGKEGYTARLEKFKSDVKELSDEDLSPEKRQKSLAKIEELKIPVSEASEELEATASTVSSQEIPSSETLMAEIKTDLREKIAEAASAGVEESEINALFDYDILPPIASASETSLSSPVQMSSLKANVSSEIAATLDVMIATKQEDPAIAAGRLQVFRDSVIADLHERYPEELMNSEEVTNLLETQFRPEAKSIPEELTEQGFLKDEALSILSASIQGVADEKSEKRQLKLEAQLAGIRASIEKRVASRIPAEEKREEVLKIIRDNLPKEIESMPEVSSELVKFENDITTHIELCIDTFLSESEASEEEAVSTLAAEIRESVSGAVFQAQAEGVASDKIEQLLKAYLPSSREEIAGHTDLTAYKQEKKELIEQWLISLEGIHKVDQKEAATTQMAALRREIIEKTQGNVEGLRKAGVDEAAYIPILDSLFPPIPDAPMSKSEITDLEDTLPMLFGALTEGLKPAEQVGPATTAEAEGIKKQGIKDSMTEMYRRRFGNFSFKPYSFDNKTRLVPEDGKTTPFDFQDRHRDDYVRACFTAEGFSEDEANFLIDLHKKSISSTPVPASFDLDLLRDKLADKKALLYMRNIPQSQVPTEFETRFTRDFKSDIVDVMDRGASVSKETLAKFRDYALKRQPGLAPHGRISNQVGVDTSFRTIFARTLPYSTLPSSASTSDYNIRVGSLNAYNPGEAMVGEQKLLTFTDRASGDEYVFMGASALHGGHYHHHSVAGNLLKEDYQTHMGGTRTRDLTTANLRGVLRRGRELDISLVKRDVVEKILEKKPDFFTTFTSSSSTEWTGNNCWFVQGIQRGYLMYKMNEALSS